MIGKIFLLFLSNNFLVDINFIELDQPYIYKVIIYKPIYKVNQVFFDKIEVFQSSGNFGNLRDY